MLENFVTELKRILSENGSDITEVYGSKAPVNATLPYIVYDRSYTDQFQTKDSNSAAMSRIKAKIFYGSSTGTMSAFMRCFGTADLIRKHMNRLIVTDTEYRIVELESDYSEEIEQDFITLDIEVFHPQN